MSEIMNAIDIIVSRSGAMTITEIALVGKPAIFIPLPSMSANRQVDNANVLAKLVEAKIILNDDLELVTDIDERLADNQYKYGKKYCPCSLNRNDDTICMCKDFREQDYPGECHCGKFVKVVSD